MNSDLDSVSISYLSVLMVASETHRKRLVVALVATAATCALMLPGSALAAGPFKSVLLAGLSPYKSRISGGLNVSKRCRANRTVQFFGANPVGAPLNLTPLGSTKTSKSGNWLKDVAAKNHYVIVLLPKRVGTKTCSGGSYLYEITLT
jgi:hypothetical protein